MHILLLDGFSLLRYGYLGICSLGRIQELTHPRIVLRGAADVFRQRLLCSYGPGPQYKLGLRLSHPFNLCFPTMQHLRVVLPWSTLSKYLLITLAQNARSPGPHGQR